MLLLQWSGGGKTYLTRLSRLTTFELDLQRLLLCDTLREKVAILFFLRVNKHGEVLFIFMLFTVLRFSNVGYN